MSDRASIPPHAPGLVSGEARLPARARFGWTELMLPEDAPDHWAHAGAAIGPDGACYVGGARGDVVHRLAPDGAIETFAVGTTACHGLAADGDGVWIADPGRRTRLEAGALVHEEAAGQVVHVTGSAVGRRLAPPADEWRPTDVALDDFGRGSDGRIWVADGYGTGRVHCFDRDGRLVWSVDGSASGLSFRTPHGVVVDDRGEEPRLLVADRGNRRIVVLSLDGEYAGELGAGILTSPSGLAVRGDRLWVAELVGSVVALDPAGRVVERVDGGGDADEPGWPNRMSGELVAIPELRFGEFRSPHGIAVLPTDEVVVTESLLGGRVTILSPM